MSPLMDPNVQNQLASLPPGTLIVTTKLVCPECGKALAVSGLMGEKELLFSLPMMYCYHKEPSVSVHMMQAVGLPEVATPPRLVVA